MSKKLVWSGDWTCLALAREDDERLIAQVQRFDETRWVAIVVYDVPGCGAACVRPRRDFAREWVEEAVAAAWPGDAAAVAAAREELLAHEWVVATRRAGI